MAENKTYKIQDVSGNSLSGLRVPMVQKEKDSEGNSTSTPEWMISIIGARAYLKSDISGFEEYTELLGWHGKSNRESNSPTTNSTPITSSIKHSDVVVVIPNSDGAVLLESCMNNGTPIESITIIRVSNTMEGLKALQTILYQGCKIKGFQQELDHVVLTVSVRTKTNTVRPLRKETGQLEGNIVTYVDYTTNSTNPSA